MCRLPFHHVDASQPARQPDSFLLRKELTSLSVSWEEIQLELPGDQVAFLEAQTELSVIGKHLPQL